MASSLKDKWKKALYQPASARSSRCVRTAALLPALLPAPPVSAASSPPGDDSTDMEDEPETIFDGGKDIHELRCAKRPSPSSSRAAKMHLLSLSSVRSGTTTRAACV